MSLTDKRIEEILKEVEPHAVRLPLGWKLFARAIEAEVKNVMCDAIKAEDDHCADGDYMLDSDDCISVIRGEWIRPVWLGEEKK